MKKSEEISREIVRLKALLEDAIKEENKRTREVADGTNLKCFKGIRTSGCSFVLGAALSFPDGIQKSELNRMMAEDCSPAFSGDNYPASGPVSRLRQAGLIIEVDDLVCLAPGENIRKVASELINPDLKKKFLEI